MHVQYLASATVSEACPLTVVTTLGTVSAALPALQVKDGILIEAASLSFDKANDVRLLLQEASLWLGLYADEAATTFVDWIELASWQGAYEAPARSVLAYPGEMRVIPAAILPARVQWAAVSMQALVRNSDAGGAHNCDYTIHSLMRPLG